MTIYNTETKTSTPNSCSTTGATNTVSNVTSKLQNKGDAIVDSVAEKTHEGLEKVGKAIESLACHAEKYNEQIGEFVKDNSEQLVKFVKNSPVKSVFMALGAGLIIGMLLKK